MRRTPALVILAAVLAAPIAYADKVAHDKVVAAEVAVQVDATALRVGRISSAVERGGMLFVAGSDGVAAIGGDGVPLWVQRLPHADLRTLDADPTGVAVISQDLRDSTPTSLDLFLGGDLAKLPDHVNTSVMLLDRKRRGAIAWTVPIMTLNRMAPPRLSAARVALSDGNSLLVLNRADGTYGGTGKTVNEAGDYIPKLQGWDAVVLRATTRNRPLHVGDGFIMGFAATLSKVDAGSGKDVWRKNTLGLLTPFQNLTAGPVAFGDKVVLANTAQPIPGPTLISPKASVFMTDADGKEEWTETIGDDRSGIGSLAVHGGMIFAATNHTLTAFDDEGDDVWELETNKKNGALNASRYRGVRYKSGWAARTGPGDCLVVDDRFVYVSSNLNAEAPRDVITVIDAKEGEYVSTLDPKMPILDLLLVGDQLVVIGFEQVRFLRTPK